MCRGEQDWLTCSYYGALHFWHFWQGSNCPTLICLSMPRMDHLWNEEKVPPGRPLSRLVTAADLRRPLSAPQTSPCCDLWDSVQKIREKGVFKALTALVASTRISWISLQSPCFYSQTSVFDFFSSRFSCFSEVPFSYCSWKPRISWFCCSIIKALKWLNIGGLLLLGRDAFNTDLAELS